MKWSVNSLFTFYESQFSLPTYYLLGTHELTRKITFLTQVYNFNYIHFNNYGSKISNNEHRNF